MPTVDHVGVVIAARVKVKAPQERPTFIPPSATQR